MEDMEFYGQFVKVGDFVYVIMGVVNCDLCQFESVYEFRLDWKWNDYLIFGYGIYFCMGVFLGWVEVWFVI